MNERDESYLQDMRDAAVKAQQFSAGKSREALDEDEILALAVVRLLEIIGEAASRISEKTRQLLPAVPWQAIKGMRNRLIHNYWGVDYNIVWDVLTNDLGPLIAALDEFLDQDRE